MNKENGKTNSEESPTDSLFSTAVVGLGLILGGVVAMKALEVREALIIAYMILSSLAFLGIYGMHIWRFLRLSRGAKETNGAIQVEKFDTKELEGAEVHALPEPVSSITENTTRSLEPSYRQKKT